jgi:hypothetical protein
MRELLTPEQLRALMRKGQEERARFDAMTPAEKQAYLAEHFSPRVVEADDERRLVDA